MKKVNPALKRKLVRNNSLKVLCVAACQTFINDELQFMDMPRFIYLFVSGKNRNTDIKLRTDRTVANRNGVVGLNHSIILGSDNFPPI